MHYFSNVHWNSNAKPDLVRWAKNMCALGDVDPNDDNLREQLGQVLYHIRFPAMTDEEIARITEQCGLMSA